jgi:hypothetical protein
VPWKADKPCNDETDIVLAVGRLVVATTSLDRGHGHDQRFFLHSKTSS